MKLLNNDQYLAASADSGAQASIEGMWGDLKRFLEDRFGNLDGFVFINGSGKGDFPDDSYKCDVCFGIEDGERSIICWNYKNGPAYLGSEVSLDGINEFSVYGDVTLLDEIRQDFNEWLCTDKFES